jgi:predicted Co/Zn/Cd cation transporter (cation efflux family)
MHQMMQQMGCAHDPSHMQVIEKMTPEEQQAHMKSHMQECKAKMHKQATDEAMAKINACVQEQMSSQHAKRMNKKKMHAMMAKIRACANLEQSEAVEPAKPSTHDKH